MINNAKHLDIIFDDDECFYTLFPPKSCVFGLLVSFLCAGAQNSSKHTAIMCIMLPGMNIERAKSIKLD